MKKSPIWAAALLLLCGQMWAQCVYTCSNYIVEPIPYSTFPQGPDISQTLMNTGVLNVDDGDSGPVPIGFNFEFYCNNYTDVIICGNGFIQLGTGPMIWPGQYVHDPQAFPNPADPNGIIAFNMTDLNPLQGGTISYTTVGTSPNRMFIVTWDAVPVFSTSPTTKLNTGQIVLYETSNIIEIHTFEANPDEHPQAQYSKGTQGIEDVNPTQPYQGVTPPGRNLNNTWHALAANTAYRFIPVGPAPPTGLIGTTSLCQSDVGNYLMNASPGATAYTWYTPPGWSGTSNTTTATYTAGASGQLSVSASYTCGTSTPITLSVTVNPPPTISIVSATPQIMCSGTTMTFNLSGAATYTIDPGGINGMSPLMAIPYTSTSYSVSGTSLDGCNSIFSPQLNVTVNETPTIVVSSGTICLGESYNVQATGAASYNISSGFFQVTPATPGLHHYTVTGMGTNGCLSAPVLNTVVVNDLPAVNIVASNTVICRKDAAVLTATGAATYSWSHGGGTGNMTTITPTIITTFSVTGTSAEGCKKSAALTVSVSACNGISEFNDLSLNFYPNPAGDKITVRSESPAQMTITDLHGRVLIKSPLVTGDNEIKLEQLPPGSYFIQAESAGKNYKGTLLRQ